MGAKDSFSVCPRKKKSWLQFENYTVSLAIEVQIIGVKAILGLDYLFIVVCYLPCSWIRKYLN